MMSGSASWMSLRTRASTFPRQCPSSWMRWSIEAEADSVAAALARGIATIYTRQSSAGLQACYDISHRGGRDGHCTGDEFCERRPWDPIPIEGRRARGGVLHDTSWLHAQAPAVSGL